MAQSGTPAIEVMVATPAGAEGQGGIARLMEAVRGELFRQNRSDVHAVFVPTRGSGHIAFSAFHLAGFCLRMIGKRLVGKLDVVHLNLASGGSTYRKLIIAGLARLLGVPYVVHLHGGSYPVFWNPARRVRSALIGAMFLGAARILVLGLVWEDFIAGKVPEAAERIVVLPNATTRPTLEHKGGGDSIHILFLGRINANKGVPELGEALFGMASLPNWHATIAGDGYVEMARDKVLEMGLADRIAVPGWVSTEAVAQLLASADILVLPSHEENLPISVIEGMASGLAIVATPVGAVSDIVIDGETGLLVPVNDAAALSEALSRLVRDPALRQRLGQGALAMHRARLDLTPYVETLAGIWTQAAQRG
jgi:glycosyltransferase involved in cell wall biosynthesis